MTIDEAIAHAREVARINRLRTKHPAVHRNDEDEIEACILCAEAHEQLAEWLEELKAYRNHVFSGEMTQSMLKEERNKAIDDFVNNCSEYYFTVADSQSRPYLRGVNLVSKPNINKIAEQLKEMGGSE